VVDIEGKYNNLEIISRSQEGNFVWRKRGRGGDGKNNIGDHMFGDVMCLRRGEQLKRGHVRRTWLSKVRRRIKRGRKQGPTGRCDVDLQTRCLKKPDRDK